MQTLQSRLGRLDCTVLDGDPGTPPRLAVILCHGYGAPGTDLVPLAPELVRRQPALAAGVRFVFPTAPLSLDAMGMFGGRAWWSLDVERIARLFAAGRVEELLEEVPEGLAQARRLLLGTLDVVARQTGLGYDRIVLGGFSQGAMLAIDVTLRLEEAPASLVVLSGTVIAAAEWRARAPTRRGLPVLASHGRSDPLLPFQGAVLLRELLTEAGLDVEFIEFPGPHTVAPAAIDRLAERLAGLLST